MPVRPVVPDQLRGNPFRGSTAVRSGLLTRAQLAGPSWRRLFPDIYVHARVAVDQFTRCEAAALLLPPGAAIAGRSAASLLSGSTSTEDIRPVEVAVPAAVSMRHHAGLRPHRTRLDPEDVVRFGAIPVTVAVRTAFDLARRVGRIEAVTAVDGLLNARALTLPDLRRYADDRAGWPGADRVPEILRLAMPGAESPMETRLRLLLVLAGLPVPATQYQVAGYRLDLAYPQVRLAIEYDGDHHRERDRFRHDVARLNRLRLLGWTVLRFTADDLLRHPDRVLRQVRQALRPDLLGD